MTFNNLIRSAQNTQFNILVSEPVLLGNGFISDNEEIDFEFFKSVEEVR